MNLGVRYIVETNQPPDEEEYEDLVFSDKEAMRDVLLDLPENAWPIRLRFEFVVEPPVSSVVRVISDALVDASEAETAPLHHPDMRGLLRNAEDVHRLLWDFATDFVRRVSWPHSPDRSPDAEPMTFETFVVFNRWYPGL